jgi:type II secretory pathway component GspD/PulD (secretin)
MAGTPPALRAAPPDAGMPPDPATPALVTPAQPRAARAHIALNTAIECNRRGEYEQADVLFKQALLGQGDLSPTEQQELVRLLQSNAQALQARREGSEQLAAAEQALKANRAAEAAEMLKRLLANQYLTPVEKQRAQMLADTVQPRGTRPSAPGAGPDGRALNLARTKLQQARALLAQGNYDAAQQLTAEAQALNAVYTPDEDNPAKVLQDIYKVRSDPKATLIAARAALKRGDLDQAEALAQEAARHESRWNLNLWGDSPSQVLKEVKAARAKGAPGTAHTGARSEGTPSATEPPAHAAAAERPSLFGSMKGVFGSKAETTTAGAAPSQGSAAPPAQETPASGSTATERARALIAEGRQALKDGKLDVANDCAIRARDLSPTFGWWDDTPDKLQADVQRALARRPATLPPTKPQTPEVMAKKDVPAKKDTPEDPRALLHQGRELYAAGKFDEAARCADRARQTGGARWGIFEDSPDKLQQDIDEARAQHDRDESVKLMAEARQRLGQGEYDEASRLAYRAQKLHGPYSWWDLGDRPMKLIAEVETARSKKGLPPGPRGDEPSVAARDKNPYPAVGGGEDERASKARQAMLQARLALSGGDVARAEALLQDAAALGAALPKAEDQAQLDALRRDIGAARLGGGPAITQTSATGPAVPMPSAPVAMPAPMMPAGDPAKAQAQQLLAECRQLQRQGRLVEARQKALAAQAAHAAFGTTEDSPEQAMIQLSALGYKQIDGLMQQAADYQATAAGNPANLQKAEQNLREARALAAGFGFDTALVDARLQVVAQAQVPGPGGAPGEVRVTGSPVPEAPGGNPGLTLLVQAREALRRGDTPQARRMAEDAYKGPYGLQAQAESMLRSVDAEEFAQQRLAADRTFDAGMSAFRRKEYAQAAAILHTLNPRLLDDTKQASLKNVFALPEMQPSQIAQVGAQEPGPGAGTAHASDQVPAAPGRAPVAATTPAPDQDILKITQAMQDVKFQQLRADGLAVQREAAERFKAGDTARAIDILQEYEAQLSTTQLDADRVALLRRPIESRLLTFRTLKAQRDFEGETMKQHQNAQDFQRKAAITEKNKQQKVAGLMQQYNAFYKEGKYTQAEACASAAFELDPDNAAAGAAVKIARVQRRQVEYQNIKDRKENYNLNAWNDAEDPGEYVDEKVGVLFDKERTVRNAKERKLPPNGIISPTRSEKEKEIEQLLQKPVNLAFTDAPLEQVLDDLRAWHGLNIVVDQPALDGEGISLSRPVKIKLDNVSLKSALNLLLHQVHLTYVVKDEVLQITTEANARGKQVQATYQVADLITPLTDTTMPNSTNLLRSLDQASHPQSAMPGGGSVTPYQGPYSLPNGSQAGSQSSMWGGAGSPNGPQPTVIKSQTATMEDSLIKLITNTIQPHTWASMGGQGTIDYYPLAMTLVINQTPDIQEQIADLLAALRRLQDQEVAVEVRFISVAEGFYERIGLDFNVNFKSDANQKFGPQLTSGQFQPAGFVDSFNPSNFVTGLTPAGTFTSDLNIPINASSFGMAIPPFGGFPNIPGLNGGIDLGLAFLSDVQVFMFMEAAQGDQRTNVMQAPKLTLSNGQTSQIFIQDQQFFVTNVSIVQQGGQLAFVPQNTNFATGVSMTIQATISADRRFVRISFSQIQLSNLASAIVPLFPVVTPIIPLFEGGFQGNPVLFTQFLQQPVFNTITVSTTVTVPDGGTVVMGGLKRLSEGRNEFGPPVLSKIPYINRLFKNTGYGREVESLLIMVTPRVIINEEEELRQTGVGVGGPGGAEAGAVGPPGLTGPPPSLPGPPR